MVSLRDSLDVLQMIGVCPYRIRVPEGVFEHVGPAAEQVLGLSAAEIVADPAGLLELVVDPDRSEIDETWAKLLRGETVDTREYSIRRPDGEMRYVLVSSSGVCDPAGKLVALEGACRDVTRERNDRQKLVTMLQLLEGSFDTAPVALAHLDRDMKFVRVNDAYASADGKDPSYFPGKDHFELFPNQENEKIFARVRDTGQPYRVVARPFEYARNPERGVSHWDWTLTPIKGESGEVTGLVLALVDVTERVRSLEVISRSEARIARELEKREALLHEVHHRVKNNLQVISSLLHLQSRQEESAAVQWRLQQTRDRVRAMAFVHELLYTSDDLNRVDVRRYVTALANGLTATLTPGEMSIDLSIDVDCTTVDMEQAIPCGLIISELVTNALKHAFVGRDSGSLAVSLQLVDAPEALLRVRDDGVGAPPQMLETTTTLGLKLVRTLVDQLRGEIEVRTARGTDVRIIFPLASAVPCGGAQSSESS